VELRTVARDPIHLVVCDDHRMLTDMLVQLVDQADGLELLGPPLSSPDDAVRLCDEQRPHVVLMDIEFRGAMSGIEATRRIKQVSPTTNVVIMTAHDNERLLVEAVEAGASRFLHKTEGVDEVLDMIKAAAEGDILIDRAELARILPLVARERRLHRDAELLLDQLTEREREVLQLLAEGRRIEEIGTNLYISPQTVQTHVRNILSKLGFHSKLEAVVFALKHGAVSL
jgi:two-component system, NarL family, response regulator LiaR